MPVVMDNVKWYTLREVSEEVGRGLMNVQQAAKMARLQSQAHVTVEGPIAEMREIPTPTGGTRFQQVVSQESLDAYKVYLSTKVSKAGGKSADGKRGRIVRLSVEDEAALVNGTLSAEAQKAIGATVRKPTTNNPTKAKARRIAKANAARDAAATAEATKPDVFKFSQA